MAYYYIFNISKFFFFLIILIIIQSGVLVAGDCGYLTYKGEELYLKCVLNIPQECMCICSNYTQTSFRLSSSFCSSRDGIFSAALIIIKTRACSYWSNLHNNAKLEMFTFSLSTFNRRKKIHGIYNSASGGVQVSIVSNFNAQCSTKCLSTINYCVTSNGIFLKHLIDYSLITRLHIMD